MKKILSFAVAVLMSMTMFAQNYHPVITENFTDSASMAPGWYSISGTYTWFVDGYIASYAGGRAQNGDTVNNILQSPRYALNIHDTNGYISFIAATLLFDNGQASSSLFVFAFRDDEETPIRLDAHTVNSTDGPQYIYIDLAKFKDQLGLEEQDHEYTLWFYHYLSTGDECALVIDKFQIGTKPVTISFHNEDNGVSGSMPDMTVFANKAFAVPANNGFVRDGYEIVGWYTTDEDGEYWVMVGDTVAVDADMRFFARWGVPTEITFDANGGQGTFTTSILVADTISPDDPGHYYWAYYPVVEMPDASTITNGNLSLAGWNTKADGTGDNYAAGDYAICWETTTFYAQWSEKKPEGINSVELTGVSIYPNPATSMVRINGVDNARIELMDMSGRTLLRNSQSNSIDLAGIANGVYMLRISTSEGSTTRQIIKK